MVKSVGSLSVGDTIQVGERFDAPGGSVFECRPNMIDHHVAAQAVSVAEVKDITFLPDPFVTALVSVQVTFRILGAWGDLSFIAYESDPVRVVNPA